MPIPKPSADEKKNQYISRVIKMMRDEGRPQQQAIAIGEESWRRRNEKPKGKK